MNTKTDLKVCINCKYCKYEHLQHLCKNKINKIDYITGAVTYEQCSKINKDGNCKDYFDYTTYLILKIFLIVFILVLIFSIVLILRK